MIPTREVKNNTSEKSQLRIKKSFNAFMKYGSPFEIVSGLINGEKVVSFVHQDTFNIFSELLNEYLDKPENSEDKKKYKEALKIITPESRLSLI